MISVGKYPQIRGSANTTQVSLVFLDEILAPYCMELRVNIGMYCQVSLQLETSVGLECNILYLLWIGYIMARNKATQHHVLVRIRFIACVHLLSNKVVIFRSCFIRGVVSDQ